MPRGLSLDLSAFVLVRALPSLVFPVIAGRLVNLHHHE
jgi:hypothetical protein